MLKFRTMVGYPVVWLQTGGRGMLALRFGVILLTSARGHYPATRQTKGAVWP